MQDNAAFATTESNGEGSEGPSVGPDVEGNSLAVPEEKPLQSWGGMRRASASAAIKKVGSPVEYPDPPSARDVVGGGEDGEDPHGCLPGPDSAPGLKGALDKLEKPCRYTEEEREAARKTMRKRARAKYLTEDLLEELEGMESPIPYGRARSCCSVVKQEDGELTTNYCRCRWCLVCNRIRMGSILNDYHPVLEMWDDEEGVYFVTLTTPNVDGENLREQVQEMKKQLRYCRRSIRETRGLGFRALENWEVTYSSERQDYNPHVHIAVRGKQQALALREEWLKRWNGASEGGQDVRKWDGTKGGMKELAKYATKMVAPGSEERPPTQALDTIFRALYRLNLINPTGFDKQKEKERALRWLREMETDPDSTSDPEADEQEEDPFQDLERGVPAYIQPEEDAIWEWNESDWVNAETGEVLTEHEPGV